jgi:rhodanese-related sulfurtransferase
VSRPAGALSIDEILAAARARLTRLRPEAAYRAAQAGALLIDIRPAGQRAAEGEIPGATIIERNVLEWRFDPACSAALPVASYDLQVIVFCSEGYTSSLAAASLLDLGVHRATDLDGGFLAWQAAGLPVATLPVATLPVATPPVATPRPADSHQPAPSQQGELDLALRRADGCATRPRSHVPAGRNAPPLGW